MKTIIHNISPGILTIIGVLFISGANLLHHFYKIGDFAFGSIIGFGIGMFIFAIYKMKYKNN